MYVSYAQCKRTIVKIMEKKWRNRRKTVETKCEKLNITYSNENTISVWYVAHIITNEKGAFKGTQRQGKTFFFVF